MAFVTTLTFTSGDRNVLESVVSDIKTSAARKGVECKGPHPRPPTEYRVPQPKRLHPDGGEFESWDYSVYTRTMRIVGHDEFARDAAQRSFPDGIHVEAEVEQVKGAGRT
ncbi:uS10/mL48 family ribosomal protein [Halomarina litorea]|uniref:uS10/mL48 family ribosomal protein n=1 Tax=Halomarina litorea TaxID=2961595 RepID=UPI0020C2DEFA|nr:uS10/mL48 family ribosomal protein [Halomarina sp. BCD28]